MSRIPRRRFLRLSGAALSAVAAGCSENTEPTVSESPTPGMTDTQPPTPTRTETQTPTATPSPTPRPPIEEAWTVNRMSGQIETLLLPEVGPSDEPAGPLYAATRLGEVARIDPIGGSPAWTSSTFGQAEGVPSLTPRSEAVYAVSETLSDETLSGHLEALDPKSGEPRWRLDDRYFFRVLGAVGDTVVVAGEYIKAHPDEIGPEEAIRGDGKLYGLDLASGDQHWSVDVPELRGADVAAHGVYAAETRDPDTYQLALQAFDLDGSPRWRVDTGTINPSAPLATDELLLAGVGADRETDTGGVGRYDPADGSIRWRAGSWERGPDDLAITSDTIHAGGHPLLALASDGGESYRLQSAVVPEVPVTPATLYNGGGTHILAVNRATGDIRWRYRPEGFKYTHIRAVLADYLAVDHGIGPDREVILLGESEGGIVQTFETSDHYSAAIGAGRRLFIGVGGEVIAYDVGKD